MVSNNRLGNSCTDSVNLCGYSSSLNADTDIKVGKFVLSEDKNGLECLQTKGFGLNKFNGLTINLDKSTTLLCESTSGSGLFPAIEERFNCESYSNESISMHQMLLG